MISAEKLRLLLSYSSETGEFRWRVSRGGGVKAGELAGCLNRRGYWIIRINGKNYYAHRLAWLHVYGRWPKSEIDHINTFRDDNRLINLREATRSQNGGNIGLPSRNTSGYKGVHWNKASQKYQVHIQADRKKFYLGLFDCPIVAHSAYLVKARELFGEFARAS